MRKDVATLFCSVGFLTLGALAAPLAAQAAPTSVGISCGQTLTANTRLTHDLSGCAGNGLVIGVDNITIDLAGHSIRGVNTAGSEGIADDGHAGAHIRNGTIADFFANGVALRNAPHSVVSKMSIHDIGEGGAEPDASAGVLVKDSPNTTVTASTVTNHVSAFQSDGVDVLSSARSTIRGNNISRNAWNGMFVLLSPHTRVTGNTFERNQNQGIEVNSGSDNTTLAGNHAAYNVSNGLVVGSVSGALIKDNVLTSNGESGLFMFDLFDSRISHNRARDNAVGIDLEGGQNVSTGNRVVNNDTSRNLQVGLVVASGANHNVVAGNKSNANQGVPGEGGGVVLVAVTGNTVRGNVANRNLDVGIGIFEDQAGDSAGNVLSHNVANFNRQHGITAPAGTVDGGHNVAHANTPLPNCIGVFCR